MSYSRWGASRWYTFWACQDEETENRDTAIFTVCGVRSFPAAQLRANIDACVEQAAIEEGHDHWGEVTDAERAELREYMTEFLTDIDVVYPPRPPQSEDR